MSAAKGSRHCPRYNHRGAERTRIVGDFELSEPAQQWVIMVLIWLGFGTLVGLLVRALIPGREPGGAVGTLFVGITGSALGPLLLSHFFPTDEFNPVSPLGFLAAVGAAFVLLIAYRILISCLFIQHDEDAG